MPEAEITCQFINHPKEGKRRGSIKSSEGKYYWADGATLKRFSVGEVCTIEYDSKPRDGGGEWLTIKRKVSTSSAPPVPQMRNLTNPKDSEQIFVTAVLKGMTGPQDSQATLVAKINMLRQAYRTTFGAPEKQVTEATLDDQIPEF